jgi:hypothetical protein
MTLLAERASGLRHLRWAREIQATLEAHAAAHGTEEERAAWLAEADRLARVITEAREAVKAYRDFKERVRVTTRAAVRVATHRGEGEAAARASYEKLEESERIPRKAAVRQGVARLRSAVADMLARCERDHGAAFAASLLPPLTADAERVIDDEDEDDDATGVE